MSGIDLNIVWFVLIGILLTGYAILDGFDLGVGSLHLLVKEDKERRLLINAIGPVWGFGLTLFAQTPFQNLNLSD